jgi:hypothetical protein
LPWLATRERWADVFVNPSKAEGWRSIQEPESGKNNMTTVPCRPASTLEVGGDMFGNLLLRKVRGGPEDSDVDRRRIVKSIIQPPKSNDHAAHEQLHLTRL